MRSSSITTGMTELRRNLRIYGFENLRIVVRLRRCSWVLFAASRAAIKESLEYTSFVVSRNERDRPLVRERIDKEIGPRVPIQVACDGQAEKTQNRRQHIA